MKYLLDRAIKYSTWLADYKFGRLHYKELAINLTSFCNSNCVYCEVHSLDHSLDLDEKRIREIFIEAKEMGIKRLDFSGGEPFVFLPIWDLIIFAKELGFTLSVATNGLLINNFSPDQIEILKNFDTVYISLDSNRPEIHNTLRGGLDHFEKTISGIKRLRDNEINVAVSSVISYRNFKEMENLISFVKTLGVNLVLFQPVHICSNYQITEAKKEKEDLVPENGIKKAVEKALYFSKSVGVKTNLASMAGWIEAYFHFQQNRDDKSVWMKNMMPDFRCFLVFNKLFIHSDGSLLPCNMLSARANVKNMNLSEAVKVLEQFKTDIKNGIFRAECNRCSCRMNTNYILNLIASPIKNRKRLANSIRNLF